jgi:hypothetical protein
VVVSNERMIEVRPSYGWGWANTEGAAWDHVPDPFHADVTPKTEIWYDQPVRTLQGEVVEEFHPQNGYSVLLSQRHVDWDGDVNITLRSSDGQELSGYGSIDLASFDD